LGVFWAEYTAQIALNDELNLCGSFERWTTEKPNWLPDGWRVIPNPTKEPIDNYCIESAYRYAWVPIWEAFISDERAAAEYLGRSKVLVSHSLQPSFYNLDSNISRKEVMKIIINSSELSEELEECKYIFADVDGDWGCKYIEAALEHWYIAWNEWFRPDDTVSKSEALKLIFKARWIVKRYDTGNWQEDYISSAYYLWYIDNKPSAYTENATRWWIFSALAESYDDFEN